MQTRVGGPFSGEEMLFIKLKSGECVCISAVEVGGAGFPFVLSNRESIQPDGHHKDLGGLSEREAHWRCGR